MSCAKIGEEKELGIAEKRLGKLKGFVLERAAQMACQGCWRCSSSAREECASIVAGAFADDVGLHTDRVSGA